MLLSFLTWGDALKLSVCLPALYALGLVFYRLFLHPLRNFPGPKLAAASYWYDFYYDVLDGPHPGRMMYHVEELHKTYGPVVRVNPDELAIKNPDWVDIIYNNPRRQKWPRNHKANGSNGSMATTESRELHKLRKAPLLPFFSKQSIISLEPELLEKVEQLCKGVEAFMNRQEVLNIGVAFTALTLDVISEYTFGKSWSCLDKEDFAPEWKKALTNFEPVPVIKQFPFIPKMLLSLPEAVVANMSSGLAIFLEAKKVS
jgi:hypothetical protein